jgi:threonine dehydrogenase-like Zn-dependent dehydrogenase
VASADQVVRLPEALGGMCFPGEALGCAFNVFRRCAVEPGQWVAVVGVGFLGALLVNLAARAGARVIAISRRPYSLDVARRMGATETVRLDEPAAVVGAVKEIAGAQGCPRVIEATGLQEPLDVAAELTAERGRLIIAGYHQDGARQVNMQLWNWRGLDVINAHERDLGVYVTGMRAAAEAVASGRFDPRPLFTHRFALDELSGALDAMRQRSGDFLKATVHYD